MEHPSGRSRTNKLAAEIRFRVSFLPSICINSDLGCQISVALIGLSSLAAGSFVLHTVKKERGELPSGTFSQGKCNPPIGGKTGFVKANFSASKGSGVQASRVNREPLQIPLLMGRPGNPRRGSFLLPFNAEKKSRGGSEDGGGRMSRCLKKNTSSDLLPGRPSSVSCW